MNHESQKLADWHALDLPSLERELDATPGGLTAAEAAARLVNHGPNELPHAPPPAWWQIVLRQFLSPLIYILVAAAIVSVAVGHLIDAGVITVAILVGAQRRTDRPDPASFRSDPQQS